MDRVADLTVAAVYRAAKERIPFTGPRLLALLAGWVGVWVVIEVLVIWSGSLPGRPIWLILHAAYFWGTAYFEAAMLRSALESFRGGGSSWKDAFSDHRMVLRFLGVKMLLLPLVLIAMTFLIVPGLYLTARYGLAPFFVVDRHARPLAALRQSWLATHGRRPRLMWIYMALLMSNLMGAAFLGLGLLVTLPMTTLAWAWIYLVLTSEIAIQQADAA